jgi:hypothetical protein
MEKPIQIFSKLMKRMKLRNINDWEKMILNNDQSKGVLGDNPFFENIPNFQVSMMLYPIMYNVLNGVITDYITIIFEKKFFHIGDENNHV